MIRKGLRDWLWSQLKCQRIMIKTTFRTEGAVSAKAVQPDRARHRKKTSVAETLRRMGNSGCVCVGGVGVGVGVWVCV